MSGFRDYMAGRWAAQEARRAGQLRADDAAYQSQSGARFQAGAGGRAPIPYERDVLAAVLGALRVHPAVAWAQRMNVGAFKDGERYVRVGFVGCSDVIGQMKDGRFLAVEVKRPGGKPTADQVAFLGRVTRAGGVGFVAWSVDDIKRVLA